MCAFYKVVCRVISIAWFGSAAAIPVLAQTKAKPPGTVVRVVTEVVHGVPISDPYRWLEDQHSPETRTWIEDQNRYSREAMSSNEMQQEISRDLEKLLQVESIGIPVVRGDRYFI